MKLGEFLNKICIDAGIAADDADLKAVLSSPTISEADLPDSLATKVTSTLMTEASAEANPRIKSKLTALALNPIDTKIDALAEKHKLVDKWKEYREKNVKKTAEGKFNTYESIEKFNEFLAIEVKAGATGHVEADKKKLIEDIEKLNGDIVNINQTWEQKVNQIQGERSQDKINWSMDNLFTGFNYALEKSHKMPKAACIETARTIAFNKMKESGLKVSQDEQGNIVLKTKEDTPYFEQNKQITVSDYISKVLADNNLLEVSAPSDNNGDNKRFTPPDLTKLGNGAKSAVSKLQQQLAEAEKA